MADGECDVCKHYNPDKNTCAKPFVPYDDCLNGAAQTRKEKPMNEPITPEQSKKLLQAIFAEEDTDEDNYPETISDKVSYSEYVLT